MNPYQYFRRLALIFVVVAGPLLLSACSVTASCDMATFSYSVPPSEVAMIESYLVYIGGTQFGVLKGASVIGTAPLTLNPDNPITINFPSQPAGETLELAFLPLSGPGSYPITAFKTSSDCSKNLVTWFNPGDGRVDGQPGDRLAVYCDKKTQSVIVWGVKPDSHGLILGVFPNSDLLKAGTAGIFKPDGVGGQISVDTDGKGNYWAAWNGGQFKADGLPKSGFAKGVHCDFTS